MTTLETRTSSTICVERPRLRTPLLICGSRKPAPGLKRPSAARELLRLVGTGMVDAGGDFDWLDVRDLELPFFDGRDAPDYQSADLDRVIKALEAHPTIVLSVPGYWAGPSGVVKNLFDLIGGAAYDADPGAPTPLTGKLVALLVVGSNDESLHAAVNSTRAIVQSLGAWTAPRCARVGNLRTLRDRNQLVEDMRSFGAYVHRLSLGREVPWHAAEP